MNTCKWFFHETCTLEWLTKVIDGILAGQYFGGNTIPDIENVIEIGRYDWLQYLDHDQVHVVYCIDSKLAEEAKRIPKVLEDPEETDHMTYRYEPRTFAGSRGVVFSANQEYRYGLVLDKKCFVCTGYEVEGEKRDVFLKQIKKILAK